VSQKLLTLSPSNKNKTMTRLHPPELDRDRGVNFEGLLAHTSARTLTDYVLANFLPDKQKPYLLELPVSGNLFGHLAIKNVEHPLIVDSRLKLNTASARGFIILDNIDDEAKLSLSAEINDDLYEKESASLKIEAIGRLIFNRLRIRRVYRNDIDRFKLNDVAISAELYPDNQVRFSVGIEFRF
jgi:hypothetical protein